MFNIYILYIDAISCKGFAIVAAKNKKIAKDFYFKYHHIFYHFYKKEIVEVKQLKHCSYNKINKCIKDAIIIEEELNYKF